MSIGWYTPLWDTAVSPFTIFGPLCLVISFSVLVEGMGDYKRHKNDRITNEAPCVVLHRISRNDTDMDAMEGALDQHGDNSSYQNKKRQIRKERRKLEKIDLSEHFTMHQYPQAFQASRANINAGAMAAPKEMKRQPKRISRKFKRGIEIRRDKSINNGEDVFVPLLPAILEEESSDTLEPAAQPTAQPTAGDLLPPNSHSRVCFQSVPRKDIRLVTVLYCTVCLTKHCLLES